MERKIHSMFHSKDISSKWMKSAIRSKRCVKIIRSPQRFVHITDIISFNRKREKKSTVSYHASSISDFTSSTEEVTHYSIRMALSSDHSDLILLEPVLSYRSPQLCEAEYEKKIRFHVRVKRMSFEKHTLSYFFTTSVYTSTHMFSL